MSQCLGRVKKLNMTRIDVGRYHDARPDLQRSESARRYPLSVLVLVSFPPSLSYLPSKFGHHFVVSQLLNSNKCVVLHDSTEVEAVYDLAWKVYEARCPRCAMIVRLTKNANPHALNAYYRGRTCDNALRKLSQLQAQGEVSATRMACFPPGILTVRGING